MRIPQSSPAALAALGAVAAGHAEVPAPRESSVASPWAKYCGREPDAGELCFTGGEGCAGQQVFAAVLIEPEDESRKRFRIVLRRAAAAVRHAPHH